VPASPAFAGTDAARFVFIVAVINTALLVFNLLPVYPLDGGQILQAILWFIIGRARSLLFVASFGVCCALVGGIAALMYGQFWLAIMALFVGMQSMRGIQIARVMQAADLQPGIQA
jgi:Zn-dependent protease